MYGAPISCHHASSSSRPARIKLLGVNTLAAGCFPKRAAYDQSARTIESRLWDLLAIYAASAVANNPGPDQPPCTKHAFQPSAMTSPYAHTATSTHDLGAYTFSTSCAEI